uniref:Nucleoside-diphosphate kinase n=1 Tax=Xenopus tropicalis TaxID=8364 RepID=A0A6I8PXJ3_XENTR
SRIPNQLGLHGTGKTTLGRWLQENRGWKHFSVGDFARKAKLPNTRMNPRLVTLLMKHLQHWNQRSHVVCDGFPSEPMHLQQLPAHARILHITCADREQRIALRSENTNRYWTPGSPSYRDHALPLLLQAASPLTLATVNNDSSLLETTKHLVDILSLH